MALRKLPPDSKQCIYTDSSLCMRTLTEWAPKWEQRGWTKGDGKTPENLDLVQEALALYRARPGVRFEWLRGHAGSTWNECVDLLAGAWRE